MSIYSPEATMQVYEKLNGKIGDVGLLDSCCGKPLEDIGLSERASKWLLKLEESLREHNCAGIITACPNCYYYLRSKLQEKFKLLTVYEVLEDEIKRGLSNCNCKVTVHDSCPDRFKGIFAAHVRGFFRNHQIVEMKHCKEKALCCGAGGMVSCADPNLPAIASEIRAKEFFETNAELMVVYCYTCAQMFWASQPEIKTKHILDLALKTQDMSEEVKSQELSKFAIKLLTGLAVRDDS
jgi:Fe-S oxidoreductase